MDFEYRRKPSNIHSRIALGEEVKIPCPGFPASVHDLTRVLRESMTESGTGHSPTEFWSSFESKSGYDNVSEYSSERGTMGWFVRWLRCR